MLKPVVFQVFVAPEGLGVDEIQGMLELFFEVIAQDLAGRQGVGRC
ncbi:hypothetical protein HU733_14295 [Pseudomonas paralactis]|nr:hypothetical protein [Pseudomonas paralactis]MBC3256673.1 hypothetical protein [Pseudomonas paralactis]